MFRALEEARMCAVARAQLVICSHAGEEPGSATSGDLSRTRHALPYPDVSSAWQTVIMYGKRSKTVRQTSWAEMLA